MKSKLPFAKVAGGLIAACFVVGITIFAFSWTAKPDVSTPEQAQTTPQSTQTEDIERPMPSKTLKQMAKEGNNAKLIHKLTGAEQKTFVINKLSEYPRLAKYKNDPVLAAETMTVTGDVYDNAELQQFIEWRNNVYVESLNKYVILLEEQRAPDASGTPVVPTDAEERFILYSEKETEIYAFLDASELVSRKGDADNAMREQILSQLGAEMDALKDPAFNAFEDAALADKEHLIKKLRDNMSGALDDLDYISRCTDVSAEMLKKKAVCEKIIAGGQAILDKLNALPDNDASSVVAEYKAWADTDWWGEQG